MAARACLGAARALEMAAQACPGAARAVEMAAEACPAAVGALEMAAAACPVSVAPSSVPTLLCSPCSVHGYARIHTSVCIYIYIYILESSGRAWEISTPNLFARMRLEKLV